MFYILSSNSNQDGYSQAQIIVLKIRLNWKTLERNKEKKKF